MGLKTSCDGCGRSVTGVTSSLKKVGNKYLCQACVKNPTGALQYHCTNCSSYFAYPKKKGSGWIELVLYLFYIVPGIIYSIWRRSGNSNKCPHCGSTHVISAAAGTHIKCPDCAELVLADARKCKHCGCALAAQ